MSDQKKCVYCCGDVDVDVEKFGMIQIPFGDTSLDVELWIAHGDGSVSVPRAYVWLTRDHLVSLKNFRQEIVMNYCPVCGRRL